MGVSRPRFAVTALAATLFVSNAAYGDAATSGDLIVREDPRFEVFELTNSAGDGSFVRPDGTVLLSFASKDSRYCRVARFVAQSTMVLACREESGWRIEAASALAPQEAANPTAVGGGGSQEIGSAVERLRAGADFLDELGIVEAAAKGWRHPIPVDERTLSAADILDRTGQVYRAGQSYLDTGTVRTVYSSPSREWTGETTFKTAYVAPDSFRFESSMRETQDFEAHFIVWSDASGVHAWYNLNPDLMDDIATVQSALDAGAGISRDSSGMIPGLIFSGTKLGGDIVRLTSAVRLEDVQVDGFDCFQVQGFRWPNSGKPTTVWIDKGSFLIRRVYEEGNVKDTTTRTTWAYEPAINVQVHPESLLSNIPSP